MASGGTLPRWGNTMNPDDRVGFHNILTSAHTSTTNQQDLITDYRLTECTLTSPSNHAYRSLLMPGQASLLQARNRSSLDE